MITQKKGNIAYVRKAVIYKCNRSRKEIVNFVSNA